jgi:tyrosine-protein kinase Etk/Wzc
MTDPSQSARTNSERTSLESTLHYIGILLRYKWFVIIITILAAGGSVAYSILTLRLPVDENPMPNFYTASATIVLKSDEASSVSASSLLSSLGFETSGDRINYGAVVQRVLTSRPFIDAVVDEFGIIERNQITNHPRTTSRNAILGSMSTGFDARSGILWIAYNSTDPVFAAEVTNRIVSLLEEWFAQFSGSSRQRQVVELEEKLQEVEESIQQLETQIVSRQQEMGVLSVEEIANVQARMLADLQSRLVPLEIEIRNYERRTRIEEDATLSDLRAQRRNLQELIRDVEEGYAGGKKTMPARVDLPRLALEMSRLQSELGIRMRIYETLAQQYEVTRLAVKSEKVMTILEAAEVPEEKSGPSRGRLCIRITLGAFFGSIILAFLHHIIRSVIFDPEKLKFLRRNSI